MSASRRTVVVSMALLGLVAIGSGYAVSEMNATRKLPSASDVRSLPQQTFATETQLTSGDAHANDFFGRAVAISGDTLVVGANGVDSDTTGRRSGAAYVFQWNGSAWIEQAKLTALDAEAGDEFGYAVAIDEDTIAVGAHFKHSSSGGNGAGAVYVFARSGDEWIEQSKLVASNAAASGEFGSVLAMSGDTLAVANGRGAQTVYVFRRSGNAWTQEWKLTLNENAEGTYLRTSLALSGETLIVGGLTYGGPGLGAGAVYVFQREGGDWSEQAQLAADDVSFYTGFGSSVALDEDTLAVGAPGDSDAGIATGAVYLFRRDGETWTAQGKLTASDAAAMDSFGSSVALQGHLLFVGAGGDNDSGFWSGSAYVFRRSGTGWIDQLKLIASDEASGAFFGSSAAISGNSILIGAPDEFGHAAYVYELIVP